MPRALYLCLTIVAAFPPRLFAAGPAVVMAPVSPAVVEAARTLGMEPERDRGRFLSDLVRLLHGGPPHRGTQLEALARAEAGRVPAPLAPAMLVPVPLDAETWGAAVFRRRMPVERLVSTILLDRRASLLASGLATLDDETLEFLSAHPATLTELYERSASSMAAFGASLRIRDGRIVTPGGDEATHIWEAIVGAAVTDPESFIVLLFGEFGGRVAYVYDTVAGLNAGAAAFALSAGTQDPVARLARVRALVGVGIKDYREWKPELLPFSRAINDLPLLLTRMSVDANGTLRPPASRAFWAGVWGTNPAQTSMEPATRPPTQAAMSDDPTGAVDAAWLADAAAVGNMYERGDRLDQIAFAQRVFGSSNAAETADAVFAVRAFPRQKMLMLALERMGFRVPALFAFVSRQATKLDTSDGNRGFWVMAQVQSAFALVARMSAAGTIDARRAETLVRTLFSVPLDERGRYAGALARWVEQQLSPALPPAADMETRIMLAMSGPRLGDRAPRIEWEGGQYRIDLPYAEQQRLRAVRDKQGGYTVDVALAVERLARRLSASGLDDEDLVAVQRALADLVATQGATLQMESPDALPPGVSAARRGRDVVDRVSTELAQAARTPDLRRAARQAATLFELADVALGESLLSLAYAADIGDPSGSAMLARNVALRHDFGFGHADGASRDRTLWAVPRQDFQPGVPWHVTGSVVGLDIALARLSLTRINSDRLAGAPRVPSNERDGFAVGLALLDPRLLDDRSRDEIAGALARGAGRIKALSLGDEPIESVSEALSLDPLRRRSLALALREDPAQVPELFTLVEQLTLGGMAPSADLNRWGVSGMQLFGCPCTRYLSPADWKLLIGRPQMALAAAAVPDLNLRVAEMLAELRLPALLTKPVLAAAVQDFVEDAAPMDGSDWWALSRAARAVSRERIEDYVAAAASVDGALVPIDEESGATPDP